MYEQIPVMESGKLLLRKMEDADAEDLLKVYRTRMLYRFLTVITV